MGGGADGASNTAAAALVGVVASVGFDGWDWEGCGAVGLCAEGFCAVAALPRAGAAGTAVFVGFWAIVGGAVAKGCGATFAVDGMGGACAGGAVAAFRFAAVFTRNAGAVAGFCAT